jgi:hypothetical protein
MSGQPATNHRTQSRARAQESLAFSKWSPAEGVTFLQFVGRLDGAGGFAVVETDDSTLIARDAAIFGAFFDIAVYPVVDVEEAARITGEAIEFRQSD